MIAQEDLLWDILRRALPNRASNAHLRGSPCKQIEVPTIVDQFERHGGLGEGQITVEVCLFEMVRATRQHNISHVKVFMQHVGVRLRYIRQS